MYYIVCVCVCVKSSEFKTKQSGDGIEILVDLRLGDSRDNRRQQHDYNNIIVIRNVVVPRWPSVPANCPLPPRTTPATDNCLRPVI